MDLQQFHVWNPEWLLESDEWRRALEDLKSQGKARFVGVSINDHQPDSALDLIRTGVIDTVQVIYNVFDQSPEAHLFPLCREYNIGVLARVPLDEGALTGKLTPTSTFDPEDFRAWYFRDGRLAEVTQKVRALQAELPQEADLAALALRFCLSAPAVSTVIPGMRSLRNVEANVAVSEAGPLPAALREVMKRHAWPKNYYQ